MRAAFARRAPLRLPRTFNRPLSVVAARHEKAPVHRIVLTGGPCGGKSTALVQISERLAGSGFKVWGVPEAATLLINGGVNFAKLSTEQLIVAQSSLIKTQIAMENALTDIAVASNVPSVVLCDRGAMDGSAYMDPAAWATLLDTNDWTVAALRDRRYDAVVHLVTAAIGAEKFYTLANNAARSEGLEAARAIDYKIREAWVGAKLRIIDNSTDFKTKVDRTVTAICRVVGVPGPLETRRYFVVEQAPGALPSNSVHYDLEYCYLAASSHAAYRRVERRLDASGTNTYSLMEVKEIDGKRSGLRRPLSAREYFAHVATRNPQMSLVRKRRSVFLHGSHQFELDTYAAPQSGLRLLAVEVESAQQQLEMPSFLTGLRDVSGDEAFRASSISRAS